MTRVEIHDDAERDLDELRPYHPALVNRILITLQEIQDDPRLLDALLIHEFGERDGDEESIGVKKWLEHWKANRDLWRLKLWQLEDAGLKYRIVYAYMPDERTFYVLAIRKREDIDYDDHENELTRRIIAAYRGLQ